MATRSTARRRTSSTRTRRSRPKPRTSTATKAKTKGAKSTTKTSAAKSAKSTSGTASKAGRAGAAAGAAAASAASGVGAAAGGGAASRGVADTVSVSSDARSQASGTQTASSPLVQGIQDAYSNPGQTAAKPASSDGQKAQPKGADKAQQTGDQKGAKSADKSQQAGDQKGGKEAGGEESIEQHEQRIQSLFDKMQKGEIGKEEFEKELGDFYNHAQTHHQQQLQQQRQQERQEFENDWQQRQDAYGDRKQEIDGISNTKNDDLRNLKITQEYSELSQEMRKMLGPDAGANWATWATWASKQAGQTIRQEDLGSVGKFGKGVADSLPDFARILPPVGAGKAGADLYDKSSQQIAKGNRKVFQEIAPHFARFAETFKGDKEPNAEKLKRFQEGFKPGPVERGGQDLLRGAFTNYYNAMFETDTEKKKEMVFAGNGQIGMHEQTRLQPEIQGALPYGSRGLATDHMMSLGLPNSRGQIEPVPLGEDVKKFNGRNAPYELQTLENPDAKGLVNKFDENPYNLEKSGAEDWTKIPDRMGFILDLFRSRHDDTNLFQAPFSPSQTRSILAGRVPGGSL